jgi:NAD-dependent dihydropyrimidine dehydrogenase PreA subunit
MINVEREKCLRCWTCVDVCPHATLEVGEDSRPVQVRPEDCMECGACAQNCQGEAITVEAGVGCFSALVNETLFGKKDGCG